MDRELRATLDTFLDDARDALAAARSSTGTQPEFDVVRVLRGADNIRARALGAMSAITSRAKEESRDLLASESRDFDAVKDALRDVDLHIDQLKAEAARMEQTRKKYSHITGVLGGSRASATTIDSYTVSRMAPMEARDRAMRIIEDAGIDLDERAKDQLDAAVRADTDDCDGTYIARRMIITETDAYRSAWQRVITDPRPILTNEEAAALRALEDLDRMERRAMSIGTDSAGGYGVPVLIDPTIIVTSQGTAGMDVFEAARRETITTDTWKGITSAGVTWSFDAEASTVSDDTPTLAQPSIAVHMARGFVPFSIEVGMDYPNFADNMSRLLGEGYLELAAEKLTNGNGSTEPKGFVTALDADTTVEVTPTTDGAFGAVDLYKLWDALPRRWRVKRSTGWMSSTDVQNEVRNFGSTLGSNFTTDLRDPAIPALFGRRYWMNDFMGDFTATTGAANLLVVGDWEQFVIVQRAGMSIELVPHLFDVTNNRPTGQRGWFAWARIGSDVTTTQAFRILQNQ